jgi:hypothetical protein
MTWNDTGMDVAARKRVMRFRAFGDSGFASLKCKSSLPPETPILRWTKISTLLLMSDACPAKING